MMQRLALVPLLLTLGTLISFTAQVQAQTEAESTPEMTAEAILQACAQDRADTLPSPFTDVSPTDWAYKAVLTLYYCGAYRGAIPAEQYQRYLEENQDSPT